VLFVTINVHEIESLVAIAAFSVVPELNAKFNVQLLAALAVMY
jgi:hypothetical protein